MAERTLRSGDVETANPTEEQVSSMLDGLREASEFDRYLAVDAAGGDDGLTIYFVPNLGFYVSGCGENESDYFTVVERPKRGDSVLAFVAGDEATYVRGAFISVHSAKRAAMHFLETGERAPDLTWWAADDVML